MKLEMGQGTERFGVQADGMSYVHVVGCVSSGLRQACLA